MVMLPGQLLPFETIVFRSDVACIGRLECGPAEPLFEDSGPVQNHVVVFPRSSVLIEHDRGRPFVAGPNVIPLYNAGQRYRRRPVSPEQGVCSDWFAVAPDILVDMAAHHDRGVHERPEQPFALQSLPAPHALYAWQRRIIDSAGAADRASVEEDVLALVEAVVELAATRPVRPRMPETRERVEQVKLLLASGLDEPLSLRAIASRVGISVYYLCKLFRRETGYTVHAYRQQLRLRRALDDVLSSRDLLDTALSLGFDSHSHFTYAFRTTFGITPSRYRASRVLPPPRR